MEIEAGATAKFWNLFNGKSKASVSAILITSPCETIKIGPWEFASEVSRSFTRLRIEAKLSPLGKVNSAGCFWINDHSFLELSCFRDLPLQLP